MEKILIKANGQWTLIKSKMVPYKDAYSSTIGDHRHTYLSENDNKLSQNHMLKYYKDNNHTLKDMVNHETGKSEPHMLMERGVGDEQSWRPNATGPNMVDWATNPKHVSTSNYSVMAASDLGSPEEDKKIPSYTDGNRGMNLKFWVPMSHILGGRKYLADNHATEDTHAKAADQSHDDGHIVVKPGKFPLHSKQMVRSAPGSGDPKIGKPQLF